MERGRTLIAIGFVIATTGMSDGGFGPTSCGYAMMYSGGGGESAATAKWKGLREMAELATGRSEDGRRNPVADLHRRSAFLVFLAILAAFRISKLLILYGKIGFDSRRRHHT
jgi:hypothetical protein